MMPRMRSRSGSRESWRIIDIDGSIMNDIQLSAQKQGGWNETAVQNGNKNEQ
jgi:hypothetical protein